MATGVDNDALTTQHRHDPKTCPLCRDQQFHPVSVPRQWIGGGDAARLQRVAVMQQRIDELLRMQMEPRLFIHEAPRIVAMDKHIAVLWSAFCQQWVVIAATIVIGFDAHPWATPKVTP